MITSSMLRNFLREEGFRVFECGGADWTDARVVCGDHVINVYLVGAELRIEGQYLIRTMGNVLITQPLKKNIIRTFDLSDPDCFNKLFTAIRALTAAPLLP